MAGDARSSGMRGMRGIEEPAVYKETPGEEQDQEAEDNHDEAEKIESFVHGPDENGHHHLNVTKLHEHLHKKK